MTEEFAPQHNFEIAPVVSMEKRVRQYYPSMKNSAYDLLLDPKLLRDFRRDNRAITHNRAKEFVNRHNETADEQNQWSYQPEDVNNDGINDVIIRDINKEPIFINGWTTKPSDWPLRQRYYNSNFYRLGKGMNDYRNELGKRHPEYFEDAKAHKYYGIRKPISEEKRNEAKAKREKSPYTHFKNKIMGYCKTIIEHLLEDGDLPKTAKGKLARQTATIAKVIGLIWNQFIIIPLRNAWKPQGPKHFKKMLNSADGKGKVAEIVMAFMNWAQHAENEQSLINIISDTIISAVGKPDNLGESMKRTLAQYNQDYERAQGFNRNIGGPINYDALDYQANIENDFKSKDEQMRLADDVSSASFF